jgi:Zn-dependent peptidase ImmA (M78 family)/DNA-binding XRE family transcriptional regulator
MNKKFQGSRLKNARSFRALTLTELAEITKISKQSISLYENNRNIPEHERVRLIAAALNFPYNFFFQEDKNDCITKTGTTYFRSLASATKKDRIAQSLKLEYVAKMYETLLECIDFPPINIPDVNFIGYDDVFECDSDKSIQEIETIAENIRKHWGISNEPIKNLQYLLEKNGIIITGFDTQEDKIDAFSQSIIVNRHTIFLIAVSLGSRPEGRIRFDMAHELGHILLHPWSEDLESITKDEFKVRERQANMFASAFLLPASAFGKDIQTYPTDLNFYQFLKKKWKVSIQAMIYRAHQLKIITDNQYQYLMRQVSKNGWRSKEPGDVPYKLNETIFQGAIDLLLNEKILTTRMLIRNFERYGVTLYPREIEELLHLREGTLILEDLVTPIIQLRKNTEQ